MKKTVVLTLSFFLFSFSGFVRAGSTGLLRFPTIHKNRVVFSYAGDLYTVPAKGGTARKLTNHVGFEIFAPFSPDGRQIAFTGQYDGNTEVYVMPSGGGVPERLTYQPTLGRDDATGRMGPATVVMGWTPDGKQVVFRSRRKSSNSFIGQLYTVNLEGDMSEQLPFSRGGFCSFSADRKRLAYNRIFREFRTWKRYRGGMADDIWVYNFEDQTSDNITDNPAQDIIPMWHGNKVYFLSDRDESKRMNLYVYDRQTKETRRLTEFADFDIKFPSIGPKAIVFEKGGFLYRFDLKTETSRKIPVRIREDMDSSRDRFVRVDKQIDNYGISPDGKRGLFTARGDIFTVPQEGVTRNLTESAGVHDRNAVWSPNGKWVAFVSDKSGEDNIYITAQDGSGPTKRITNNNDTYIYALRWSPDSRKILWADKRLRLRYVDIKTRGITEVDESGIWEFSQYRWSPDSEYIVYPKSLASGIKRIYLYSVKDKESFPVTESWYNSSNPVFSSDGKFVFFVSSRDFNPIYSHTEWNHAYVDMEKIYMIALSAGTESPFRPVNEEVAVDEKEQKSDSDKNGTSKTENDSEEGNKQKEKVDSVVVDKDGIISRIAVLPVSASNYFSLSSSGDILYYCRRGSKDRGTHLFAYDLKDKKQTDLGTIGGYVLSADRKKMLVRKGGQTAIINTPKSAIKIDKSLDLSKMEVYVDLHAEWEQIFNESWRQMREFMYVPNMHGVDWKSVRAKYAPLLKHLNHRADLTYLIGEMVGELNVGHAYVGGGDYPKADRNYIGQLGAELERDKESGFYRITKILKGQNWDRSLVSPLTRIGADVSEGDYILGIDGKSTADVSNIYTLLRNKGGRQVLLKVNDKPSEEGSRQINVITIKDQQALYYFNWVQSNIKKVSEATDGKVGYLHVPDMGRAGLNEFVKYFYPQIRKKALIIDVRGNGGGNVSPMLIERLRREAAMITFSRNTAPSTNPSELIYGPMVCLCDEHSASDGDLFTYRFKHYDLGLVIGKRTWGGVVGIRGSLPLLDGGTLHKPEFSRYDLEGKEWIIEGVGVEPDIVVENDPAREYRGIDDQLNKAIEVVLEKLKTEEKHIPPLPEYPER